MGGLADLGWETAYGPHKSLQAALDLNPTGEYPITKVNGLQKRETS